MLKNTASVDSNFYNALYQLYLNKTERKNNFKFNKL